MKRRFAAVLPTAVTASASAFADACAERAAEREEDQRIRERGGDADAHEARDPRPEREPRDALEVVDRGADDGDARVRVVDPVDRHLVDPQPAPLGEHEQLRVEEPALVADVGEQRVEDLAADRLEAALRVGEAGPQRGVEDPVVAARDQLAPRAADDAGAVREARPDRDVGVSRQQRGDERQQPAQVGREVGVHVTDHAGPARRPGGAQRAAAALAVEPQVVDARELVVQPRRDRGRRVGGRVVGDHDPPRERELGRQVAMQTADAALERRLLVQDRDHDVDLGRGRRERAGPADEGGCGHGSHPAPRRWEPGGSSLRGA